MSHGHLRLQPDRDVDITRGEVSAQVNLALDPDQLERLSLEHR